MSRNEITGDKLISKVNTKEYEDNYDRIFGKKKEEASVELKGCSNKVCFCTGRCKEPKTLNDVTPEEWDEARMNVIAQNGNEGLHYKQDNLPLNEYPDNSKEEAS